MNMATTYRVTYERDEDGWWVATVEGVQGVHTQGRTIAEARRFVREPLALAIGDQEAEEAQLIDEPRLPTRAKKALQRWSTTRKDIARARLRAAQVGGAVVKELQQKLGLSLRDISDLTGLSRQRIQQLGRPGDPP
jgi:predicted RNase H-like HicB family nuclease